MTERNEAGALAIDVSEKRPRKQQSSPPYETEFKVKAAAKGYLVRK